jgi:hypothetical protein
VFGADKAFLFVIEEHLNTQWQNFSDYFESSARVKDWVHDLFSIL